MLDDGQVVESGSHDALLAREGLYAGMWRSYLAGTTRLDEQIARGERVGDHAEEARR